MSKTLIIAEKPDMAKTIATMLEVPKNKGCYENEQFIISNCIGHLIEFDVPELKQNTLPIIPKKFQLKPKAETAQHYQFLCNLIHRSDVSLLVNACDADRAGEHIFRLVYQHSGSKKPVKRMWIQSTTKQGLRLAFDNLKNGSEYDCLAAAEQCRAEADWLFGINGSRAVGNAIGRVMTPTLAMVVDAYIAHKDFKPENYWEIQADFKVSNGIYTAKLLDENQKTARFNNMEDAQKIIDEINQHQLFTAQDEAKTSLSNAPYLFDANELQKVANKKLGLSADKTLSIMQNLYEKHKVLTYPRSDFNALPLDYLPTLTETIMGLSKLSEYNAIINDMKNNNLIKHNVRVFDDARIGSHYAIVPTGFIQTTQGEISLSSCSSDILKNTLSHDEYDVFNLVVLRTLAALYPAAEYAITNRTTKTENNVFHSTGRVLLKQGWLKVYGNENIDEDTDSEKNEKLPVIEEQENASIQNIQSLKLTTKAPPLMTESNLIQAMKTAGRDLEDKHLANLMKEVKGIGTSATRAPTIKKLKSAEKNKEAYLLLEKNKLIPSQRGIDVISHLRKFYSQIADPILTAEWEDKLNHIEQGKYAPNEFRIEIQKAVCDLVQTLLPHHMNFSEKILCSCPNCKQGNLKEQKFSFNCDSCDFKIYKEQRGRALSNTEIQQLSENGKTDILQGFISKEGKNYSGILKLVHHENKLIVQMTFPERTKKTCPCCSGDLNEKGKLYECQCGFKLWKTVSGKDLTENQIEALIKNGETNLIKGFNKKDGGKFNAILRVDKTNKQLKFVFESH